MTPSLDTPDDFDLTTLGNGQVLIVHPESACQGPWSCSIHRPSDHRMVGWPLTWRDDRGFLERKCEHGIGHPDPDDIAYHLRSGRDTSVHG